MSKSFNLTQKLICHLCGEIYSESTGHLSGEGEMVVLKRVSRLRGELATTEKHREEASLARQRHSDEPRGGLE